MVLVLAVMLSLITLLVGLVFFRYNNKGLILSIDNIFNLVYLMFYTIFFPFNIYLSETIEKQAFTNLLNEISVSDCVLYYIAIIMVLIGVNICFKLVRKDILLFNRVEVYSSDKQDKQIKSINKFSIVSILLGGVSLYLFTSAYGGYFAFFEYAGALRSGIEIISNPFSIFSRLYKFSNFAFFLLFGITAWCQLKLNNKIIMYILLIISFTLSIMNLSIGLGRVAFGFFFLNIIFAAIFYNNKTSYINFKFIIKISLTIFVIIMLIMIAGVFFSRNSIDNLLLKFCWEFTFVFNNFNNIINSNYEIYLRYFADLLIWPVYILPSSWYSAAFGNFSASDVTTLLATGYYKGDGGVTGEIPVDLVSICFMQFHYFGIVISACFWAYLGCLMLRWIDNYISPKMVSVPLKSYVLVEYFLMGIIYADPKHFLPSQIPLIAFMLFVSVSKKIRNKSIIYSANK